MLPLFKTFRTEFFFFLLIQISLRTYFCVISSSELLCCTHYIKIFIYGLFFDIATFGWILLILFFTKVIWLPKKDFLICRIWYTFLFLIFAFIILLSATAEIIFWDEFKSRFNFIAVDYLIYTEEVIKNLIQSYAFFEIIVSIFVSAIILTIILLPVLVTTSPTNKLAFFLSLLVFNSTSYFIIHNEIVCSNNRYVNEIAKNGLFSLFSAYLNNDLPYKEFYLSMEQKQRFDILQSKFNSQLQPGTIVRRINTTGKEKKHNIVIITVESLSASFLKYFGNQQNISPYLDNLISKSVFFTNMYATGTRTVYGLAAITLAMPPIPGNSIVRRPANENMFSLGSILKKIGYHSQFIYGGFGYFDNMNYFFVNNEHQIIDRANFSSEEITFSNAWGVCDEDLLKKVLNEADALYKKSVPFFQMIMTTSNHRPFTFPEGKIDLPMNTRESAVKYTDYAIGQFLESAKSKPWFNNTIFVIIADHTASSCGKILLDPNKHHIPLLIYAPNILPPQIISSLSSQIDLAPTLLGILNLTYETKFYGFNLLKENPNRAFISNYRELGYIEDDKMVILSPIKKKKFFIKKNKEFIYSNVEDINLLETAISYFQTASEWKLYSKNY